MIFVVAGNNDHLDVILQNKIYTKTLAKQFSSKGLNMGFYTTAPRVEKFGNHGNSSLFTHGFTIWGISCQSCDLSTTTLKYSAFCRTIRCRNDTWRNNLCTTRRTRFCTEKFACTDFIYGESRIISEIY